MSSQSQQIGAPAASESEARHRNATAAGSRPISPPHVARGWWRWLQGRSGVLELAGLVAILIVAASLRAWGLNFGLPYLYHPDEPGYVSIAQRIFRTGDLNPHFFNYPTLFFYLNALAYVPYYVAGTLLGLFQSRADLPAPFMLGMGVGSAAMPSTFLLGRALTAAFGVGSVALVYLISRRLSGRGVVALVAALLLAISPTNVTNSRYITPDTFVVFFALLAFWAALHVYSSGRTRDYVVAGLTVGLVASAKYNGALMLLVPLLAHFLGPGRRGVLDWRLAVMVLATALGFVLTSPFALLDYNRFLTDLQFEARHYATGHAGMEGESLAWYVSYLGRVEGPYVLLALLQIGLALRQRSRPALLLTCFPLAYFIFISSFAVRNDRTVLPVTAFLCLLAAWLVGSWPTPAGRLRRMNPALVAVGVVLLLVSVTYPLVQTVQATAQLAAPDGRETARVWLEDNLPRGSSIALESYAPFVNPDRFKVRVLSRLIEQPADWYEANGIEYMVFSQGMFGRFYAEPKRYANEVSKYEELARSFPVVREFDEGGYEIRVHAVSQR